MYKKGSWKSDASLSSHAISNHRVNEQDMTIRIRLTPLVIVVKSVRPDVPATTVDLRTGTIPRLKQRCRSRPIVRRASSVERSRLADTKRVRDLVHRRAFRHVRSVGAKSKTSVVVGVGSGHAGHVRDVDGFADIRIASVSCDSGFHSGLDASVCVCFIRGGV